MACSINNEHTYVLAHSNLKMLQMRFGRVRARVRHGHKHARAGHGQLAWPGELPLKLRDARVHRTRRFVRRRQLSLQLGVLQLQHGHGRGHRGRTICANTWQNTVI